jgi:hypothetical protein
MPGFAFPEWNANPRTWLKIAAVTFLVVGPPVAFWIASPEAVPPFTSWDFLLGLGWLVAACALAVLGLVFPRLTGWLLILASLPLFPASWFAVAWGRAWSEEAGASWSEPLFVFGVAGTPFVGGVLFLLSARAGDRETDREWTSDDFRWRTY